MFWGWFLVSSVVVSEPYAGLQAQALGLAEAAGLAPGLLALRPRRPWAWVGAAAWPWPLRAVGLSAPPAGVLFTAGGTGGAVGAACHARGSVVVQVQNPRMALRHFDLVVANAHDGISGPNVIVTRTALHRATAARLAAAGAAWGERLAGLPRPLVAVLVGGSNGRFRLEAAEGAALARQLVAMMAGDRVGVALTASRRTPAVVQAYFARLACAARGMGLGWSGGEPVFRAVGAGGRDRGDGGFDLHGVRGGGDFGAGFAGGSAWAFRADRAVSGGVAGGRAGSDVFRAARTLACGAVG